MGVERESVLVTSGATGVLGWNIEDELDWRRIVLIRECNLWAKYKCTFMGRLTPKKSSRFAINLICEQGSTTAYCILDWSYI